MNKEKLLSNQHEYYSQKFVLFEIIKTLKNRELALLNSKSEEQHIATRYLYASSVQYLEMHLKELGVMRKQKLINLYRSNSTLQPNSIPVVTYDLKLRKTDEKYLHFKDNFNKYITGIDFIIDIDAKTIERAYEIAEKVKRFFDYNKLPYFIQFSGTRGFHLIIPCDYIPSKLQNSYEIALKSLILTLDCEGEIDLSTLNPRGLIKVPYSFDTGNIALPLSDEQFKNFKIEIVKMENVLKDVKIKNRGLLIRTHNLSKEELIKNVTSFLKQ